MPACGFCVAAFAVLTRRGVEFEDPAACPPGLETISEFIRLIGMKDELAYRVRSDRADRSRKKSTPRPARGSRRRQISTVAETFLDYRGRQGLTSLCGGGG